jgi:hypothetical protein
MYYEIFDSSGNLVESFPDEESARTALNRIVDAEPEAAEDVALFVYDDNGMSTSDPIFARTTTSAHG